jgi:hypothetical protein
MNLVNDLWTSDSTPVIKTALTEIANHPQFSGGASIREDEVNMTCVLLGVHAAVVHVLQKHVDCLEIQEEGMEALILILSPVLFSMPTRKALCDIGWLEIILTSMQKYPDSEAVQMGGCFVIGGIVYSFEDDSSSDCIAVVIAAMKNKAHQNSKRVQEIGTHVLSTMIHHWEESKPLIVKAGGASAIAFVMEKYAEDDTELCEFATNAMVKLTKKP